MRIIISGGSGFLGSSLAATLRERGHTVQSLTRRRRESGDVVWDPEAKRIESDRLEGCDAVIHLAGASLASGRWTAARKREIWSSRVEGTRFLVDALAALARPPRLVLSGSGINFYGNDPERVVTEADEAGRGFLAELCAAWEAEATRAEAFAERVAYLRSAVVLSGEGGAFAKMRPAFKAGLGGPLGDGRQWFPWIALDDWARAAAFLLEDPTLSGPFNLVAPEAIRQGDFARSLGKALGRPARVSAPKFALRLALGEMADEALLCSVRAAPAALEAAGFSFQLPTVDQALARCLQLE